MAKGDAELCRCERCNSYPDCAVEPGLLIFCLKGKAPCEVELRGCQCRTCAVYAKNSFVGDFFCGEGKAKKPSR
ncbi:MAG TPA: DUF2769 domain-containing protein [Methanomassiliicoccales archaeon]|nr:DUF2769 domain-containing protein [Methanomassiliicoccales archaeon]